MSTITHHRDPLDYAVDPTALYDRICDAANKRTVPVPKTYADALNSRWMLRLSENLHLALRRHYKPNDDARIRSVYERPDRMSYFAGFRVDEEPSSETEFAFVCVIDNAVVETR